MNTEGFRFPFSFSTLMSVFIIAVALFIRHVFDIGVSIQLSGSSESLGFWTLYIACLQVWRGTHLLCWVP
jgi:hypothetical protein